MTIHFELPESFERLFRSESGDVNRGAKEAALIELYRRGLVSHGQLAEALGLARAQIDVVLKQHGVVEDLPTSEELAEQVERMRRLVG